MSQPLHVTVRVIVREAVRKDGDVHSQFHVETSFVVERGREAALTVGLAEAAERVNREAIDAFGDTFLVGGRSDKG